MMLGLFPGRSQPPDQSSKVGRPRSAVTTSGPRNIDLVAIGYGFRPRLRGRLTLRGLALRRNPWTSGDRVSHPVDRYSCQHAHFRYLQPASRPTFAGLRNAPLPGQRQRSEGQMIRSSTAPAQRLAQTLQHLRDLAILVAPRAAMSPRRCSPGPDNSGHQTRISSAEPMAITTKRRNSAGDAACVGQSLRRGWRRSTCSPAAPDRPAPRCSIAGKSRLARWTSKRHPIRPLEDLEILEAALVRATSASVIRLTSSDPSDI